MATRLNDIKTLKKLKELEDYHEEKTFLFEDDPVKIPLSLQIREYFRRLVDSIFPPKCLMCDKKNPNAEEFPICPDCLEIFNQYEKKKVFHDEDGKVRGVGIYRYDGVIRYFTQKMKYERKIKIAEGFGEIAVKHVLEFCKNRHINYIVPIPCHETRLKERGFNQAEVIARVVAKKTGMILRTDLVARTRYTEPQSKLSGKERAVNVKDSFKILDENEIRGKDILLLDDIYTTGSTIEECSKVLKEHNTRKVYFLSLCVSASNKN